MLAGQFQLFELESASYRLRPQVYELFMKVLFEINGSSCRIPRSRSRAANGLAGQRVRMAVTAVMMLCLAGIAFNVRFLMGLHKERSLDKHTVSPRAGEKKVDRAA